MVQAALRRHRPINHLILTTGFCLHGWSWRIAFGNKIGSRGHVFPLPLHELRLGIESSYGLRDRPAPQPASVYLPTNVINCRHVPPDWGLYRIPSLYVVVAVAILTLYFVDCGGADDGCGLWVCASCAWCGTAQRASLFGHTQRSTELSPQYAPQPHASWKLDLLVGGPTSTSIFCQQAFGPASGIRSDVTRTDATTHI